MVMPQRDPRVTIARWSIDDIWRLIDQCPHSSDLFTKRADQPDRVLAVVVPEVQLDLAWDRREIRPADEGQTALSRLTTLTGCGRGGQG